MADLLIANVLSRRHLSMTSEAVIDRLKERFDVEANVLVPTLDGKTGFVLAVDGHQVAVIFEGDAMPLAELETLHGDKRDADGPLLQHRSHAALSLLNLPEEQQPKMHATLRLVQTIASVAEEPGVSAILWSFSQALVPVGQFLQMTGQWTASPSDVPLFLLARIAAYKEGAVGGIDCYGMFGVGFRPFFGRDIEFPPEPLPIKTVAYCFEMVARWSMLSGPVLKDGDTCGASQTERILIRHRDVGRVIAGPVLTCAIERIDDSTAAMLQEC